MSEDNDGVYVDVTATVSPNLLDIIENIRVPIEPGVYTAEDLQEALDEAVEEALAEARGDGADNG